MNSFLKGFFSVFNLFPSSKSYDEIKDEVEELYFIKVTSSDFLDEMIRLVPSGCFVPYSFYNEDMDSIQVYFKNDGGYTQPLNEAMNLYLSFDTNEIVGAEILNVKKLLKRKILPTRN